MALKIRGATQIKDASVSLSKIVDVNSKTILGRHETTQGYGIMKALTPLEARQVLELDSAADAVFSTSEATTITANSSLISSGSLTVSGTTTLSGPLKANGSNNTLNDATITNALVVNGSATMQSGANVTGETETDTLTVNSNATFEADATVNGTLTSSNAQLGETYVTGKIEHTGTGTDTLYTTNAEINGGSIDGTTIGSNIPSPGTFTTLEATGNLTVSGDLTVSGSLTSLETSSMLVKDPMILLGSGNQSDTDDVGFVGQSSAGWHGLVRDASDSGKFKLFSTPQDLSTVNVVDFNQSSKGTLVSDIEGNIEFDSAIDIILMGDVTGSASFSGNNDVTINATIEDLSIQIDDLDFVSTDVSLGGLSSSDTEVPSQLAVKTYVDNKVATGGYDSDDLESMDMLMSNGTEFVPVKEAFEMKTIEVLDLGGQESISSIELSGSSDPVDSNYEALSNIFLNGQKLRYGADANAQKADYYFTDNGASERKVLVLLGGQVLNAYDELEIRYFVES